MYAPTRSSPLSHSSPCAPSSSSPLRRSTIDRKSTYKQSKAVWHDKFLARCASQLRADRLKHKNSKRSDYGYVADQIDLEPLSEEEERLLGIMVKQEWSKFYASLRREGEEEAAWALAQIENSHDDPDPPPDLDDDQLQDYLNYMQDQSQNSMQIDSSTFKLADSLSRLPCPCCAFNKHTSSLRRTEDGHIGCDTCQWSLTPQSIAGLHELFQAHGEPPDHEPLVSFSPYTGTIIHCKTCDAEFAA